MRAFVIALFMALSACATAPPSVPVSAISADVRSWGYVQDRWLINADGRTVLDDVPDDASIGTPFVTRIVELTPSDFERVRQALAPAEAMLRDGVPCERVIADGPYGAVRWQRPDGSADEIAYDLGCRPNPRLDLLYERMDAAAAIIREATAAP